jgi:DnaJ family protein A protein 5
VPRDADEKTIKKAHRKLALKFHPDKNYGDEEAAKEFRLVQQAYECLSDPGERKYYDEHRESILRGVKPGDEGQYDIHFIFDVTPYHFSGCYDGYGDGEGGFFQVYSEVFQNIMEGEEKGWISEGNIDETKMPNAHLPLDFGNGSTDWKIVSKFYSAWENFSSCLSFAWADKYDPREAESRWVRRRIEEENKKARRVAKKERNDDIIQFVSFVKKRDPRVKAARERAEQEKALKAKAMMEDAARKKEEAAAAREAWLEERETTMKETEMEDLNAGRIRLADLDDSDDEELYGARRGRKAKKGRKKGRKNRTRQWSSSSESEHHDANDNNSNDASINADVDANDDKDMDQIVQKTPEQEQDSKVLDVLNALDTADMLAEQEMSESSYYDEEEDLEPLIWKCEFCNKTFKSEAQFENHLNSKKHKETFKKWQKKNKS